MDKIILKQLSIEELNQLQKINRQSFAETFSSGNTEENIKEYLDKSFSTDKLKSELADKNSRFYFAFPDDVPVGYLKINFGKSQTEIKDEQALEIERIYVLKEFHGKKVGQLLYEKAVEIAQEKGLEYVWLGVWEENLRAIQFYRKNGFEVFDKHFFKLGNEEQTDIMMKLATKKN